MRTSVGTLPNTARSHQGRGARRAGQWRRERGRAARMGSIGRYIFRTTLGAFLVVLVSVTALMWITQALRDIDLMTNQGQSILVFVGITGLIIPLLSHDHRADRADDRGRLRAQQARQRFRTDRDEFRRDAAWQMLFRPFLRSASSSRCWSLCSASTSRRGACASCGSWATEVRADLVTNICSRAGSPASRASLTLHIRERRPNGQLLGIFIDDQRDPKERVDHPRRAGRHPQERRQHLSRARDRHRAAPGGRHARPDHRAVRQLRLRPVAARRGPAEHQIFDARALSLGAVRTRSRTIRCSPTSPSRSAPSFTTGSPPRSTRSPSWW